MGKTPQERAEALQRYIRQDVMRNYAEGFGKGLKSDDVEYYAKIHFNRDGDSDSDIARTYHRQPERPQQHQETKPENQPYRKEELR